VARHNCVEATGDVCNRCANAAEERRYGIERDDMAADREADRMEAQWERQWDER